MIYQIPTTVIVETGQIEYNNGPITTRNLSVCSAVALAFEKEVLLAHAFREKDNIFDTVSRFDVADRLVLEARVRGLDIDQSRGVIDASNEEVMVQLFGDLLKVGIPYVVAEAEYGSSLRKVYLAPNMEYFQVTLQDKIEK